MGSIEENEEELRKRELRARRFQNDQPIKRQSTKEKEDDKVKKSQDRIKMYVAYLGNRNGAWIERSLALVQI